jgi:hypothetical protein
LNAVSPANLASGVLPVGVTGGAGLTALGTVASGTLGSAVTGTLGSGVTGGSGLTALGAVTNTPMFSVYSSADYQAIAVSTWTNVRFGGVYFQNDGSSSSCWSGTTDNKFTVPTGHAGKYLFHGQVGLEHIDSGEKVGIRLTDSSGTQLEKNYFHRWSTTSDADMQIFIAGFLTLSEGDTVQIRAWHNADTSSGTPTIRMGATFFNGFKIIGR